MASKVINTPYNALTYKIIGGAMAVYRELGPGLRENTYQRSLANHLSDASLAFEAERMYPVFDDPVQQQLVGYYIPDFVMEEKVIVEIKTVKSLDNNHLAQEIGYLAISGFPLSLLINFAVHSLNYRRVFPPRKVTEYLINRQWLFIPDWLKNEGNK